MVLEVKRIYFDDKEEGGLKVVFCTDRAKNQDGKYRHNMFFDIPTCMSTILQSCHDSFQNLLFYRDETPPKFKTATSVSHLAFAVDHDLKPSFVTLLCNFLF